MSLSELPSFGRANASLSPNGYWHKDFARDVHGEPIRDIRGNKITFEVWIEHQEDKTDEQVFDEICFDLLVGMYNEGKKYNVKMFDDHTVNLNGLNRDHIHYRLLKGDIEDMRATLYGAAFAEKKDTPEEFNKKLDMLQQMYTEFYNLDKKLYSHSK